MSNLPPKDSPEADMIKAIFPTADKTLLDKLTIQYGYARRDNFTRAVSSRYGVERINKSSEAPIIPESTIIIPEIKILKYKPKGKKRDPETQVLLLGDWHKGEETPTFNDKIADKRIDDLFQNALRITELHRGMYPVNDLIIICLGDMVHGENPYQGAKVGTIQKGAVDQVYDMAFPKLLGLINSFRENFLTVKMYCVPGNHGKVSREAPETSNWDLMLYKALSKAKLPDGVEITLPTDFCQIIEINNYKFFCHHGDAVRMSNGIPYFAQTRKAMSWYITYGGFDYIVSGHIHKDDFYRVSAKTKQITNGALVSDDPYALKVIGTSTIPVQTTFGVHERHGVTWYYALILDGGGQKRIRVEV